MLVPMPTLLIGLLICLVAWAGLRISAGATRPGPALALAVDAAPAAIGFALLVMATARPLLSGVAISGIAIGLGMVDRVKRQVLREPLVFADRTELLEVVRHPQLYLPFAGTWRVLGGAAAIAILVGGAFWLEPPLWHVGLAAQCGLAVLAPLLCAACFVIPTWPPLLRRIRRAYDRVGLSRDPAADIARVGLLACCVMHATLARAERPARRRAARNRRLPQMDDSTGLPAAGGPIVIVQSESFMDAARLHPGLATALPELARLRREGTRHGLLTVPCWGANTIRTEFAMLTGLPERLLGLDSFNPYAAFPDAALPSLARRAREAGYATVCVHPFDIRFYERARVLPLLGFDHLIGAEAFRDAAREGAYVADAALAGKVAEVVAAHGPRVLVFAITMQNHGPWSGMPGLAEPLALPAALADVAEPDALGRWLRHLRGTDEMIRILTRCLAEAASAGGEPGWLMFYGDHQPSLAPSFASLGITDSLTDYVIWRTGVARASVRQDLAAHDLASALLADIADAARTPASASGETGRSTVAA